MELWLAGGLFRKVGANGRGKVNCIAWRRINHREHKEENSASGQLTIAHMMMKVLIDGGSAAGVLVEGMEFAGKIDARSRGFDG